MQRLVLVVLAVTAMAATAAETLFASQQSPQESRPEAETAKPSPTVPGRLGEALRKLDKYQESLRSNNPPQDGPDGAVVSFNTHGVDFGPWVKDFMTRVRRNWFIPRAAMTQKGHSVITFSISKQGQVSGVKLHESSGVQAFDIAAFNAIVSSNPLAPLPPKYPEQQVAFTVSFYYNEAPPPSPPSKETQPAVVK